MTPRLETDIQTDEGIEEEIETEAEIEIEETDVMEVDEMIEIEARGIIETEVTEMEDTGIERDTKAEEVEDLMIMMIVEITRVVVEGKMRGLLSQWVDIGIEDHVGKRMLMLLL